MKKLTAFALSIAMLLSFTSCARRDGDTDTDKNVLQVAVLESAYGDGMWKEIEAAYEKLRPEVDIKLTAEKNLEDVIGSKMKAGDWPDYVHLATGREAGLSTRRPA